MPAVEAASRHLRSLVGKLAGEANLDWIDFQVQVSEALEQAHEELGEEAPGGVSLTLLRVQGTRWMLAHLGAGRPMHYRKGILHPICREHTEAFKLYQEGKVKAAELAAHPGAWDLIRGLGLRAGDAFDMTAAEFKRGELGAGDRIVVAPAMGIARIGEVALMEILGGPGSDEALARELAARIAAVGLPGASALLASIGSEGATLLSMSGETWEAVGAGDAVSPTVATAAPSGVAAASGTATPGTEAEAEEEAESGASPRSAGASPVAPATAPSPAGLPLSTPVRDSGSLPPMGSDPPALPTEAAQAGKVREEVEVRQVAPAPARGPEPTDDAGNPTGAPGPGPGVRRPGGEDPGSPGTQGGGARPAPQRPEVRSTPATIAGRRPRRELEQEGLLDRPIVLGAVLVAIWCAVAGLLFCTVAGL